MTKTRLMKIGPKKPQFNCRGDGRRKRVRHSSEVEKTCRVKPNWPPTKMITPEMLNPGSEAMVHITREDIETIGYRYFRKPDIDYTLSKYHEDLVHSGQQVTAVLLRNKFVELHKNAGIALTTHNSTSVGISLFLRRTWRLRNLKSKGKVTRLNYITSEYPNSDYRVQPRERAKCCPVAPKNPAPSKSVPITVVSKTTNAVEETVRVPSLFNLFSTSPPSDAQTNNSSLTCVPEFSEPPNGLHNITSPAHSQVSTTSSSSLLDLFSSPANHTNTDALHQSHTNGLSSSCRPSLQPTTSFENSLNDENESQKRSLQCNSDAPTNTDTLYQSNLDGLSSSCLPSVQPTSCSKNCLSDENESRKRKQSHCNSDAPAKRKKQTRKDIYIPGYSFPELLHSRKENLSNNNHIELVNFVDSDNEDESPASELLYSALFQSFMTEE